MFLTRGDWSYAEVDQWIVFVETDCPAAEDPGLRAAEADTPVQSVLRAGVGHQAEVR